VSAESPEELPEGAKADLEEVFFRPVSWRSAFDETVERLSQLLRLGPLRPGMQLPSERELVNRLGISRTTLREAIRALQQDGLLETRRGRSGGTFVAEAIEHVPSKSEARKLTRSMGRALRDALDLRSAAEPKAAELAASRASEEAIERLFMLQARSAQATASEVRRADSALHIAVAQVADSPLVLQTVLNVQSQLHDLLRFLAVVPTQRLEARVSSRQHEKVLHAIADRDPRRARRAMEDHVAATEELLQDILDVPSEHPAASDTPWSVTRRSS
jgi:GntR family transcriptional repressor for pyruvate dehydrogenase complex